MQVNSAQDWLTNQKRRIVAKTYQSVPPPQSRKYNSVYTSVVANGATQRERFVMPGGSSGAIYSSLCCLSGIPGVFSTVNTEGIVRFNVIPPISVTATQVRS